jgi:hypothetical protein
MKSILIFSFILVLITIQPRAQSHKIIESTQDHIKIELNFGKEYKLIENIIEGRTYHYIEGKDYHLRSAGEPWLPNYILNIGIPFNADVRLTVLASSQENFPGIFILPAPDSLDQHFNELPFNIDIYNTNTYFPSDAVSINSDGVMRYARFAALSIAPYQFNPVNRDLIFNKRLVLQVDFKQRSDVPVYVEKISDKMTEDMLMSSVINYEFAKEFTGRVLEVASKPVTDSYWYDPNKDYYKFYLNEKGVYRITYEMLINSGIASSALRDMKFEIFNDGNSVPIDIVDVNNDGIFNSGDYFQFVGGPASPADQWTRLNIYNLTNVYWFSHQADSVNHYTQKNSYPTQFFPLVNNTKQKLFFENDFIYSNLGYATNNQRDYWFWGVAERRGGGTLYYFEHQIEDSIWMNIKDDNFGVKIKVGLHGLTTPVCATGFTHNARVIFNGHPIGNVQWNGQNAAVFEKDFFISPSYIGGDTAWFNWGGNQQVIVVSEGPICDTSGNDLFFINYIEFEYWRWNRTKPNNYFFTSPPNNFQENVYHVWQWERDNMKVYVPERGVLLTNPYIANDQYKSVYFVDTISAQTNYYCVADDHFIIPDSIVRNVPSDLRNPSNGADYIIVTHPDFLPAAQTLAEYRSNYLPGFASPRVRVVVVDEIYNEFSYGLLSPYALQQFAKYTFENWQTPAPAYIVLLGDMSHDYRSMKPNSRKNFIPSMPFHAHQFGQLPSDNLIVAVVGNDLSPDIAIGRLTSETLDEANVLVNKITTYPSDLSKEWKENVILLASGLSYQDQIQFGFNSSSIELENKYLTPNGIRATKVFNYPEPHHIQFLGGGPKMRQEIDKGAALVNYYGHGGGAQWDLIFTKDDLPQLNNGGRLPIVLSITCYTANFDNSESFGEVFTKIPNKGAIGFWGSVGLTYWQAGKRLNDSLYSQIFNKRTYIIGDAIMSAKSNLIGGTFDQMLAQLSYLGDPAIEINLPKTPDFAIKSSDIRISPQNPLKEDTIAVNVSIRNWGVTFQGDSVTLEVFKNNTDPSNLLYETKIGSFGFTTEVTFDWIAGEAGLYTLIARVNEKDVIDEIDHSDNIASNSFSVFDFGQPNIIKPVNGYFQANNQIDFVLSDIGFYFDRDFKYIIQINNIPDFDSGPVLMTSTILSPVDAIVRWKSNPLSEGEYYWRAIIFDPVDTNFSQPRIFTITNRDGSGYLAQKSHLKLFDLINIDYSEQLGSLILNTEVKPPRPEEKFFIDSVMFNLPPDSTHPVTFTTDGRYFYYAQLPLMNNITETKIYKVGTGVDGSVAGEVIEVPNISLPVYSHLFHLNGYLYTNTGEADNLLRIDPNSGDTITIQLSDSLLLTEQKPTQWGGYYFYCDGEFVYNLGVGTSELPNKFILRTFDPGNNWSKVGDDIIFDGNTIPMVMSFFVVNGYLIVYENFTSQYLRRYRLSDGVYEEEWAYYPPFTYSRKHYTITYDYLNNFVYFGRFVPLASAYQPGFSRYAGTFIEANGEITSQEIGPASEWNNLEFDIDQTNSNGVYTAFLHGKSKESGQWEIIDTLYQPAHSLESLNVNDFNYVKLNVQFVDSSFGSGQPMKFNSLKINYDPLPEISMIPSELTFQPDSMLQGIDVNMNLIVHNLGYPTVDSLRLDYYLNDGDSAYLTKYISVPPDSFTIVDHLIETSKIIFENKIKVIASTPMEEYYSYNNLVENKFYVARDTIKPVFSITFDGNEIINGDIISAQPRIVITLEDDSPLPITPEHFTLVHQNVPLRFGTNPDLSFTYTTGDPLSRAEVLWTPTLEDGRHTFEVLAKDSSGNFFDSTSNRSIFYVYSDADIRNVYNYPNPFADDTYFTFELRGTFVPEELRIKVYTVAGRLIREINIPQSSLQIGFNRFYWNGRDEDGDEIANGLYFYKVISKQEGEIKTVTQKLAKLK